MNWFYESGGQQQGPVPEHELDRLQAEGKITSETLVWREGMGDWQPLRIARPGSAVPPLIPGVQGTGEIPPGHVRCSLTGKIIPESEAVYIQGKPYSAEAKPQVLHSLQAGGTLPTAEGAERTGPDWEHRTELGTLTAAWNTVKSVLMEPNATFSNMKRQGGIGTPFLFYLLTGVLGVGFIQICSFIATVSGALPSNPAGATSGIPQATTVFSLLIELLILLPIYISAVAFVHSGVTHLSLMICGGARHPFETTFRTVCYSGGALYALMLIPVCGFVVAAIYGLVLPCIGLARTHEIATGRAVLAVYLPSLACCALAFIFGALGAFISGMHSATAFHP